MPNFGVCAIFFLFLLKTLQKTEFFFKKRKKLTFFLSLIVLEDTLFFNEHVEMTCFGLLLKMSRFYVECIQKDHCYFELQECCIRSGVRTKHVVYQN